MSWSFDNDGKPCTAEELRSNAAAYASTMTDGADRRQKEQVGVAVDKAVDVMTHLGGSGQFSVDLSGHTGDQPGPGDVIRISVVRR